MSSCTEFSHVIADARDWLNQWPYPGQDRLFRCFSRTLSSLAPRIKRSRMSDSQSVLRPLPTTSLMQLCSHAAHSAADPNLEKIRFPSELGYSALPTTEWFRTCLFHPRQRR